MSAFLLNWLATVPAYATPLLLACLGLILNERAGVLNLGAEGMMAAGALAGVVVVLGTGSLVLGVAASVAAGAALALAFGLATVVLRTEQVVTGLILVALGTGLTGVVGRSYAQQTFAGIGRLDLGPLSGLPVVGRILFRQDALVYATALLAVLVWWVLFRTLTGLRLRTVGEDPATADVSGIDVQLWRLAAVVAGGAFCGLAGGYLSLASAKIWVEGMVAGRGWIAVALVIFAQWRPGRAVLGALLFGGVEALIPRVQATGADVPMYLLMMLPYAATLVVLVAPALLGRGDPNAPGGLGLPYVRQERR